MLARALDTTVDELLVANEEEDVVITPRRDHAGDTTYWMLNRPDNNAPAEILSIFDHHGERTHLHN